MKKLIVIATSAVMGVIVLNVPTGAQQQSGSVPAVEKTVSGRLSGETIDNIQVPYEILSAIQLYFQGYAVTHASERVRDGAKVYQLQVDRDSEVNNADSFYLVFDHKWEFIAQERFILPPQPKPQAPQQKVREEKPEQQQPENDSSEQRSAQPEDNEDLEEEGGQGAGGNEDSGGNEEDQEEEPDRSRR